jgi:cob(I)alamin adenosyltransferase
MRAGWRELIQRANKESLMVELQAAQDEAEDLRGRCLELLSEHAKQQAALTALSAEASEQAQLQAQATQQYLQQSLLESENKRLRSRVQQLENQLTRLEPAS